MFPWYILSPPVREMNWARLLHSAVNQLYVVPLLRYRLVTVVVGVYSVIMSW